MTEPDEQEQTTTAIVPYDPRRAIWARTCEANRQMAPLLAIAGTTLVMLRAGRYDDPALWCGMALATVGLATLMRILEERLPDMIEAFLDAIADKD